MHLYSSPARMLDSKFIITIFYINASSALKIG